MSMRYSRVIIFFNIPYIVNKALYPSFLIISKSRVVTSMNSYLYLFIYFLIGGRLQCCVGFCYTTMQISHNYTYISSFLSLPPLNPSHPSRSSQSTRLDSLCDIATSHQLSILHDSVYMPLATSSIPPTLSFPRCVCRSVPYICVSIPCLQIGSSVQFF